MVPVVRVFDLTLAMVAKKCWVQAFVVCSLTCRIH